MSQTVWTLSEDGRELTLYEVDSLTRKARLLLSLQRREPMTEEDALRYVEANWPNKGAVRAAAETLGLGIKR
jgi:hypothetical protein